MCSVYVCKLSACKPSQQSLYFMSAPPCEQAFFGGHPTLLLLPLSQLILLTLIAMLSEFGERAYGPMFVRVYISPAFEMCWPSVPSELAVAPAAFPHFNSPLAVRQVNITTVAHLNRDDIFNAMFLPPPYCSPHAADCLQRSCTVAVGPIL